MVMVYWGGKRRTCSSRKSLAASLEGFFSGVLFIFLPVGVPLRFGFLVLTPLVILQAYWGGSWGAHLFQPNRSPPAASPGGLCFVFLPFGVLTMFCGCGLCSAVCCLCCYNCNNTNKLPTNNSFLVLVDSDSLVDLVDKDFMIVVVDNGGVVVFFSSGRPVDFVEQ